MESRTTERFRKSFDILSSKIKKDAKKVFQTWKSNHNHESLKFKKIQGKENIYSVRIGLSYRALGIKDKNTMIWFWIGSHSEYDKLIENLK